MAQVNDAQARAIHEREQEDARAKALAYHAAQYWHGLTENGIPEIQASLMTNSYIDTLLRLSYGGQP